MDQFFWCGKRPRGVCDFIDCKQYANLTEVLDFFLKKHKDKPAFTGFNHTLTYKDIDFFSNQFANYLRNFTDLRSGDRIAVQLPNVLQYPVIVYGAWRAGLIVVNTNPMYTVREMIHQFQDAGIRGLVFLDSFGHKVSETLNDVKIEYLIDTKIADLLPFFKRNVINFLAKHVKKIVKPYEISGTVSFLDALSKGDSGKTELPEIGSDAIAVLQYTGGTSGISKGAMLTHENLVANMLQIREVLHQKDRHDALVFNHGNEIIIAPLPLYHIYAFTLHLLCFPLLGDHSVLIANPKDTKGFVRLMKPWKFTGFIGLNTLFVNLLSHQDFLSRDLSSVKFTLSGGMALKAEIAEQWQHKVGCAISEAYGLTECSPAVSTNPFVEGIQLGTAGIAIPETLLKTIVDGEETSIGEPGELCVKGPQVMKGYWKDKEATEAVLDADGWLKTGDVVIIQEDGHVNIIDRIKDMILVSGFNVYPNEIEDVVVKHKQVANCAAIGVPDKQTGERVKLFVIANQGGVTAQELQDYCRESLTAYKVPKEIEFCEELPITPVGKVLRRKLR